MICYWNLFVVHLFRWKVYVYMNNASLSSDDFRFLQGWTVSLWDHHAVCLCFTCQLLKHLTDFQKKTCYDIMLFWQYSKFIHGWCTTCLVGMILPKGPKMIWMINIPTYYGYSKPAITKLAFTCNCDIMCISVMYT